MHPIVEKAVLDAGYAPTQFEVEENTIQPLAPLEDDIRQSRVMANRVAKRLEKVGVHPDVRTHSWGGYYLAYYIRQSLR